jgi:putative hydroxymethylpyrimidine transport system ATP-binding protein
MAEPDILAPEGAAPVGVSVRAARLDYEGRPLFDDLDFEMAPGLWTCVLGASGVGKTSLLRLIAGLTPPWKGSRVACSDGAPLAGRAAYMAQQDLLLPWLTVRQNVMLGPRLRGESGRERRIERAHELLAMVGLSDKAGALPATLSGGQRQRAALARTMMEDRPVVLMDEPFSALDAVTRHHIQGLAANMLKDRSVLLVTHDPMEALRLGHRIHVMAGRPATLDEPLLPAGTPPRDMTDTALLRLHGELMQRLAAAGEA